MKITVKVNSRSRKSPARIVRDRLKSLAPQATIEEMFPGVSAGRRAGLVTVDVTDEECDAALEELRSGDDIEYAQPARARRPKRSDRPA